MVKESPYCSQNDCACYTVLHQRSSLVACTVLAYLSDLWFHSNLVSVVFLRTPSGCLSCNSCRLLAPLSIASCGWHAPTAQSTAGVTNVKSFCVCVRVPGLVSSFLRVAKAPLPLLAISPSAATTSSLRASGAPRAVINRDITHGNGEPNGK